ncbi:hypothetical protein MRX96_028413 [Rhipicephalus microplus]
MSIRRLTRGNGQGQVVNVPITVPSVVECLPRLVPEDAAIDVHVKRRLVSPAMYRRGLVKRGNILAWLKHLEHAPLYVCPNVLPRRTGARTQNACRVGGAPSGLHRRLKSEPRAKIRG